MEFFIVYAWDWCMDLNWYRCQNDENSYFIPNIFLLFRNALDEERKKNTALAESLALEQVCSLHCMCNIKINP